MALAKAISPVGDELNWPRIFTNNNAVVAIFQPEIEKPYMKSIRSGSGDRRPMSPLL